MKIRNLGVLVLILLLVLGLVALNVKNNRLKHENQRLEKWVNTGLDTGLFPKNTGVVNKLNELYNSVPLSCGEGKPSYECSGLLIHGLELSEQESPWGYRNKDKNVSVAFSFLRKDNKFAFSSWYTSGIILTPLSELKENKYKALCSFPSDGATDSKKDSLNGCGIVTVDHPFKTKYNLQKQEGYCTDYGIKSVQDWIDYHKKNNFPVETSTFETLTCSFDLKDPKTNIANFNLSNEVRQYLYNYKNYRENNEILIKPWDDEKPENLPVMVIYYTKDDFRSLNNALLYQRQFFDRTGRVIPVVEIEFPNGPDREAVFKEYTRTKNK